VTLPERPPATFNICPVCWWEDDRPDDHHRNRRPGTNRVSLEEAQYNYRTIGASDPAYRCRIRPTQAGEQPPGRN
jgi:Cysteine-rich CPCC